MRKLELDRIKTLQGKETLTEKEEKRLAELLEKKRLEEEKKNGRSNSRNFGSGNSDKTIREHSCIESDGDSRKESGESESVKQRNRTESDNSVVRDSNNNEFNDGESNDISVKSGDSSRSDTGQNGPTSGSEGSSGRNNRGRKSRGGGNKNSENRKEIEEKEKLVTVEDNKPKNIKPKRKSSKKKKDEGLTTDVLGAVIQSGFGLIASVSKRKHWEISNDEAIAVAEPSMKIIDNLTAKQKKVIEKYSAPMMLASAVAGITIPRILTDREYSKYKRTLKKNGGVTDGKREITNISSQNIGGVTADNIGHGGATFIGEKHSTPIIK